jgi:hypothetical protein
VPLEFSHTLEDLIGGQTRAGFMINDLYEDVDPPDDAHPLSQYTSIYLATRAIKPQVR